jgi:small-conductance mechanosensitive channel
MRYRWLPHRKDYGLTDSAHDVLRSLDVHVRPDFRRAVAFGAIAMAALICGHANGGVHAHSSTWRVVAYGCAAAVAVFGVAAARSAAREVHRIALARAGVLAATPLRILVLLVGYLFAGLAFIDLVNIDLSRLLVGGAVTGVVLGVAAQQVLSNFFAGLVLQFTRPFVPGDYVRIRSGALGGPHEGTVTSMGLMFTMLQSTDGPMSIPNSGILASAIGPGKPKPPPPACVEGPGYDNPSS